MKTLKNQTHHVNHAVAIRTLRTPFENQIRVLIDAACAARAGAAQMSLNDWREVEQEVQRRLQYEN